MSGYVGHLLFYSVTTVTIFSLAFFFTFDSGEIFTPMSFALGAFYSILADIDSRSSKVRYFINTFTLFLVLILLSAYVYTSNIKLVYLSLAAIFTLFTLIFFKHRGIFHSILSAITLSLIPAFIEPAYGVMALWGYLSHLFLDGEMRIL